MSKQNGYHVRGAREHVFASFRGAAEAGGLEYHQFVRTRETVDACKQIARGSALDDEAREVAVLCAWFYDACYAGGSDDHARSLELCIEFMDRQHALQSLRDGVVACFQGVERAAKDAPEAAATRHVTPSDVLHDALLAVLAIGDYVDRIELLRFELERRSGRTFSDIQWTQHCIAFFDAHPYRTPFAQVAFGSRRAVNLAKLQRLLRKQQRELEEERTDDESSTAKHIAKSSESLYYHFTRIQLGLIGLADHRTSTMLHVNAIMISVVLALLARRIHTEHDLLVPTVFMLVVNLVVVFLSINSMRAAKERLRADEARVRDSNVISFLNEAPLTLAEYTERMSELVVDAPRFQQTVFEHLYFTRKVLAERGASLRRTYLVFLYGISLAVLGFVVVLAARR